VVIFADGIRESWWQSQKTALAKKHVSFANCSQVVQLALMPAVCWSQRQTCHALYVYFTFFPADEYI